jgi:hypothetical protein
MPPSSLAGFSSGSVAPLAEAHAAGLIPLRQRYPQYEAMHLESRGIIAITSQHVVSW